jgi:hypothetical protein
VLLSAGQMREVARALVAGVAEHGEEGLGAVMAELAQACLELVRGEVVPGLLLLRPVLILHADDDLVVPQLLLLLVAWQVLVAVLLACPSLRAGLEVATWWAGVESLLEHY